MLHHQQDICNLLQVCLKFKTAVQEASNPISISLGECWDVYVSDTFAVTRVASFADWLLKYPMLVGSLEVTGLQAKEHLTFARSLEQAATRFPAPWSFTTDRLTAQMITTLPPSLTRLAVTGDSTTQEALSSIPQHLTNLEELKFDGSCKPCSLVVLDKLKHLTKLSLEGQIDSASDLKCLPQQLLALEVNMSSVKQPLHVVLQHLTCLQQLQVFQYTATTEDMQQLADLAPQLTQLQHVDISFSSSGLLLQSGSIWQQLSNLCSLQLKDPRLKCLRTNRAPNQGDADKAAPTRDQYMLFMQQLSAATGLTKLHIRHSGRDAAIIEAYAPCVAQYLAPLSNLQSLELEPCPELTAAGIQQLAGLKALTSVCLNRCDMLEDVVSARSICDV